MKTVAILAGLAVLMLGAHAAFFYAIKSMNERGAAIRVDIERATAKEGKAISMNNFLRSTADTRAALDAHFVTEQTIADFIERIEGLGASTDVDVSLTAVEVPDKGPAMLNASFRMTGTFSNTYYFITLLETLPYELELGRLVMSKSPAALGKRADLWEGEGSIQLTSFLRETK